MKRIVALAAGALLASSSLIGCGTDDGAVNAGDTSTSAEPISTSTTSSTNTSDGGSLDEDSAITAAGIGPLRAGMTLSEVEEAAGRELVVEGFEDFEGFCWFAHFKDLEEDFQLLFLAPERDKPVSDEALGELGRVSAYGTTETSPARTDRDVGVGSTKAEVEAAYPGQVKATGHEYVQGGEYLDIGAADDRDRRLLRFETDEDAKVTAVHGGLTDAVQLVEGCA